MWAWGIEMQVLLVDARHFYGGGDSSYAFKGPDICDRWTLLVTLAQWWQLLLARELVKDWALPWQPVQEKPTPERVLQGLGGPFSQINTPARSPQPRGKSPGWPKGQSQTRRDRHGVVKKTKKKA